jgi:hypothetical protein
MKAFSAVVFCWVMFGVPSAFADANVQPRSISRTAHPPGPHSKASSLAPRARSKKHAYGAPIQRKILSRPAPRVKSKPLPEQHKPTSP